MKNYANGVDMPMGLGMALAKNINAMNYYSGLPRERQQEIIDHTHSINSKKEMQAYVDSLISTQSFD